MAVQKSRKTPSKRGMHRSHDALKKPRCPSIRSPARRTCVIAFYPTVFIAASASSKNRPKSRPRTSCRSRGSSVPRISDN